MPKALMPSNIRARQLFIAICLAADSNTQSSFTASAGPAKPPTPCMLQTYCEVSFGMARIGCKQFSLTTSTSRTDIEHTAGARSGRTSS